MFTKRETPPPGFVRPEEFAARVGLSVVTVEGLCNEDEIVRLDNREFGLSDYNEQELLYPNFGARGVIPESEIEAFLIRCWAMGRESGLRPLLVKKVRDFICLPDNGQLLEMVMNPRPTENGKSEEPRDGEYSLWDLRIVYGLGEASWDRLMKSGAIRFRYLWRKSRTTRVALSDEVKRLAKECPEKLPRELQRQLAARGFIKTNLEALRRLREHQQQLEEQPKNPVMYEFDRLCWRRRRDAMRPTV